MSAERVVLSGLTKRYGETTAVDALELTVDPGEFFCLLGPSGCGKTTTLRMVAGLTDPTDGEVRIGDREVTDRPSADRDTSMVFQDWALFPRRTALENVAFGPRMAGVDRETRRERARELLATVDMADHADSRPGELSGGQKQRVALARSLAVDPSVLLLDEPLSNLDKRLRQQLQLELGRIHEQVGTTMLHVTHDQDEAFTLGDRIGIMRGGELVQVGTPREVYDDPASRFVEAFLGEVTMVEGPVVDDDGGPAVETPLGRLPLPSGAAGATGPVAVSLRPETLRVHAASATPETDTRAQPDGEGVQRTDGQVTDVLHRGSTVRYYVDVGASVEPFTEYSTRRAPELARGDAVTVEWNPADLRFFDAAGERLR